jgi:hypothetical protein
VTGATGWTARAGAFHGTFGDGAAPATPFTLGGFPQAIAMIATTSESGWNTLFLCDIIPNTLCTAFMLMRNEGFV